MYIEYSARLATPNKKAFASPIKNLKIILNKNLTVEIDAYNKVCKKYEHEIIAIQKYMPGWMPDFNILKLTRN